MPTPIDQFLNELIPPIRTATIVIKPNWQIMTASPNAGQFLTISPSSLMLNTDIRDYLPELIGLESQLPNLLQNHEATINIPGIYREQPSTRFSGLYFNLQIQLKPHISDQLLIIRLKDITPKMLVEQRFIQYSNETELIQNQLTDQTQALIKANQAAQQANQLKRDFIATVSHEIRTPINAIVGMTELMQNTHLDHEQQELINTIQASSEVLLSLINNILDLSKLESGHLEINCKPFNLRHCLQNSIAIFQPTARQKQLELQFTIHPNVPQIINSDCQKINQILINLLSNAIKFTSVGVISLAVSAQQHDDDTYAINFAITDTGLGITPEQTKRLFQPFCQADASIAQQYGGTGLGLSISKQLTTLLGGTIGVDSQIGRGSTFTFSIVTTAAQADKTTSRTHADLHITDSARAAIAANPSINILVADDNLVNQKVLLKMLKHFGYDADIATNGIQVLQHLEEERYDLILMDCQMPELDGYRTTQQIHQRFAPADRPKIVAITAQAAASNRQRCQAIGMDGYLNKPIRLADLEQLLKPYRQIQTITLKSPETATTTTIDRQVLAELQQVGGSKGFVAEMIQCYLRQSTELITNIQTALDQQQIPQVIGFIHALSGSSSTIGAIQLAKQCEAIEKTALAKAPLELPVPQLEPQIATILLEWKIVEQTLQLELQRNFDSRPSHSTI